MNDLTAIFIWWLTFFVLGFIGLPLTTVFFDKFTDKGYAFAKSVSLLLISFVSFLLSIFKLIPHSSITVYTILAIFFLLNLFIFQKKKGEITKSIRNSVKMFIFEEFLFTSGLFLWSWVRAHQPDINGLEKFMDFGFINSILRSKYLPAVDMWAAGKSINYYWFGHFVTAIATRLSNIPSYLTYNLMLGTILGLALIGAFSITLTLITSVSKGNIKAAVAGGIISAILLSFAGNFHTPYYILKEGKNAYWYPDATRFIGYNPDVPDKTIHEFPIYSFVVSDLHPHLLNFPFVLLYLALLLNLVENKNIFRKTLPLGFLLGVFFMTNTWDVGNYLLVTGFVILFFNFKKYKFKIETIIKTAQEIGLIIISGIITAVPFILNFESIAQGIKLTHTKSPLWQLAILWGFPAVMTSIFSGKLIGKKLKKSSDWFILAILTASWILIFLPEFFYVKDIYTSTHYRANTMFKLTYQAFVMFYLSSGYIAYRSLNLTKKVVFKGFLALFFTVLFASILYYPSIATNSYYGDLKTYKGLNGEKWAELGHPDSYKVVLWFRENVKGKHVFLEAPGDSYTEYNLISSYTGLPTISGWFVHEWLWRGSSDFPQERVNDITEIYTSEDITRTKSLLKKYEVEYVIIGPNEHEKFPNLNEFKFSEIGKIVLSLPTTRVYQINY